MRKLADRYTIVRSVNHRDNDHAIGAYLALTGYSHPKHDILGIEPPATPQDMPSVGSIVSKLRPMDKPVFPYVTLGDLRHFGNNDSMGQNGGCLGKAYDPYTVPFVRPLNGRLDVGGIASVMADSDPRRTDGRRHLLEREASTRLRPVSGGHGRHAQSGRCFTAGLRVALGHDNARRLRPHARRSRPRLRDRFGKTAFAQNCLLSRRLVEAGIPMVTLYSVGNRDWDTHGNNFRELKDQLLPPMDQGVSALLEDLEGRGLLDETLVIWMGDMGRTPRINNGMAQPKDHWSLPCYSVVLAGAGHPRRTSAVYGRLPIARRPILRRTRSAPPILRRRFSIACRDRSGLARDGPAGPAAGDQQRQAGRGLAGLTICRRLVPQ